MRIGYFTGAPDIILETEDTRRRIWVAGTVADDIV